MTTAKLSKYKNSIIQYLISQNVLREEKRKVFVLFTKSYFFPKSSSKENQVKELLNSILTKTSTASEEEIILLNLIQACRLEPELFSKKEVKTRRKQLKEFLKNENNTTTISSAIKKNIDEVVTELTVTLIITTS